MFVFAAPRTRGIGLAVRATPIDRTLRAAHVFSNSRNRTDRHEYLAKENIVVGVTERRLVRKRGFEPPRGCPRQPLKTIRLG
jgi:hypothetical protein